MTVFINEENNEVFRTSDFVLVLCFVVLTCIIKSTSFYNLCFIIEVKVGKSANGFSARYVIKKFVTIMFHIVSALDQFQPSGLRPFGIIWCLELISDDI